MSLHFTVYGQPIPQGSLKAFKHAKTGAVITTSDNVKTKPWKQQVSGTALAVRGTKTVSDKPIVLFMRFFLARPRTVKRDRPIVKPDTDKLARAVLDALTGIVYKDDAQVVEIHARKCYDDEARCEITVFEV